MSFVPFLHRVFIFTQADDRDMHFMKTFKKNTFKTHHTFTDKYCLLENCFLILLSVFINQKHPSLTDMQIQYFF